ncbi:undecaprenyl-diphosphatase [Bacillus salipaludis]|uniref:undecaprenyl-diphosphatase n=1 Tax=Bacillus salipaludis TaxID=2547811 RepID=UPI002E1D099A|nr:undecaprenyl-diphosphatase [Bacillus salipaludis]
MDVKLFRAINFLSGRSLMLDKMMIFISNRIRFVYILILIIMFFKRQEYRKMAMDAAISILISLIINIFIKLFYFKPRPFLKRSVGILIPSKMDSSFPSKHTLLVFAVSTTIFFYHRFLGVIMGGMSFLTGLSRIWVGHHYPSDIIGSAFLGSLISFFVHKLSLFQK